MRHEPAACHVRHIWERLLERCRRGFERVTRVCLRCGRTELVWSRRGEPTGWQAVTPEIAGRAAWRLADNEA